MSIGSNIKKLRQLNNMTQEELGKRFNKSDKAISAWENDRNEPSIGDAQKLSFIFNCNLTDIIGGEEETIAAHHDGEEWTEEELKAIEDYKAFIISRRK
jgi:transcriptional regulator with XRE-family HTH domain